MVLSEAPVCVSLCSAPDSGLPLARHSIGYRRAVVCAVQEGLARGHQATRRCGRAGHQRKCCREGKHSHDGSPIIARSSTSFPRRELKLLGRSTGQGGRPFIVFNGAFRRRAATSRPSCGSGRIAGPGRRSILATLELGSNSRRCAGVGVKMSAITPPANYGFRIALRLPGTEQLGLL